MANWPQFNETLPLAHYGSGEALGETRHIGSKELIRHGHNDGGGADGEMRQPGSKGAPLPRV